MFIDRLRFERKLYVSGKEKLTTIFGIFMTLLSLAAVGAISLLFFLPFYEKKNFNVISTIVRSHFPSFSLNSTYAFFLRKSSTKQEVLTHNKSLLNYNVVYIKNSIKNEFVRLVPEVCDLKKHFTEEERISAEVIGIGGCAFQRKQCDF